MEKVKVFLFLTGLLLSFNGIAQQKIGHIDMDKVVGSMPEFKAAQDTVQAVGQEYQKELMRQQEKLQAYYQEVMSQVQNGELTPVQQQEAEKKLTEMQEDLQKKGQEFDQKLNQLEGTLMSEIQGQIGDALIIYGRENGFAYILDLNQIMYYGGGIDVTPAIMEMLEK